MVLSTLGVAADVTPSVIETFISHYLNRKPLRHKPTAHISYHEGLRLIRQFLDYASQHTVEDVQAFTGQWVPCPTWVALDEISIDPSFLDRSAELIKSQLGPEGIKAVGGKDWWQWRRPEIPLMAEWIEMKSDANERKAQLPAGKKAERIILYVHGGAYYFGSTGEHRYQMQRHARKLKARLLAPKYRLAPQFPFPCGLHDCIAAYLYLIEEYDPSTILLGGDSAGGGMVLAMLVTLRDEGIPLPAGAILLSPWVDLTHSFPSVAGDGEFDYIPANGFHHKPSMAWPPPNSVDLETLYKTGAEKKYDHGDKEAARGFSMSKASSEQPVRDDQGVPKPGQNLTIELDGKVIEIQDQIQMYAANHLLAHPLVSPVMQPSLGGLPPLLIQVGGGELLRDEQIYVAHKAANPTAYPPPDQVTRQWDPESTALHKYPPTKVQLQVWDDLCHVPHTLSFTRPAKYMYRAVSQFGAWALAHAQDKPVAIMDDDEVSVISSASSTDAEKRDTSGSGANSKTPNNDGPIGSDSVRGVRIRANTISTPDGAVGMAGDPIPQFEHHMIRQRVDRHGVIYPLPPATDISSLQIDRNTIGVIKPGPVRKWIAKKLEWDTKYAKEKRHVQKSRLKEMKEGYEKFPGDSPPPTALAGRRQKSMEKQKYRPGKSWAMAMWSGWGSKHDETTIDRKKKLERRPTQSLVLPKAGAGIVTTTDPENDISNIGKDLSSSAGTSSNDSKAGLTAGAAAGTAVGASAALGSGQKVEGSENTYLSASSSRPHNGTVAYPFKLRNMPSASLSTATLHSRIDGVSPMEDNGRHSLDSDDGHNDGTAGQSEVGGHDWIMGTAKDKKGPESSEADRKSAHASAADGATAGNSHVANEEQTENEIGGHDWIMAGHGTESDAREQPQSSSRRPPLDTFVTARESL